MIIKNKCQINWLILFALRHRKAFIYLPAETLISSHILMLNWTRIGWATKSLRCVWDQWKNYICKERKRNERKLHNQKSQQAVINGPYIFSSCRLALYPRSPSSLLLPPSGIFSELVHCGVAHTPVSRQRSKQVPQPCERCWPSQEAALANIWSECHMPHAALEAAGPKYRWNEVSPSRCWKQSCLSFKQQTLNLRHRIWIFNCMRHANVGQAN